MLEKTFYSLSQFFGKHAGIARNPITSYNYQYLIDKPAWLSLSKSADYRIAVSSNPVLYGCIDILSTAAANGKKYLVDLKGKEIPWDNGRTGVKQARRLFVDRPNPLQSVREFEYERRYMFFTFGNNYVYLNNPSGMQTDILTVQTMYNLPSEFVEPKQTGKIYDQIDLKGIIEEYALTSSEPIKRFSSDSVIHFNDINVSGIGQSLIGTSRLEMLKYPITNTQLAFEAMNVLLKSRGMQGIISANTKDATGTQIPLGDKLKTEIDQNFKNEYGIGEKQKMFLITYADVNYQKTIMSASEMGIYKEFSNNAMIISNGFKIPPEIYKTYMEGATFENQSQAVRRLYQDTVIPMVENEDQYYTERLGLRNYGLEIRTDFSHIPALQEAFKEKASALSMNTSSAEKAYNQNLITWNQYLELMELEPVTEGNVYKFERDESIKPEQDEEIEQTGNGEAESTEE